MYRTRDWRRAQRQRFIKRAYKKERNYFSSVEYPDPISYAENIAQFGDTEATRFAVFPTWEAIFAYRKRRAVVGAKTRVFCSGPCCGNQRRWFGHVTKQEQRFALHCEAEY